MFSITKNSYVLLLAIVFLAAFLRLWKISTVPVSLYSDEVDLGYQANSILKTGKDYFGNPWPLNFHSYADFRTPLNIYFTVPFVFLFGITPLAIRLPSAIFGTGAVYLMYLVVKEILSYKSKTPITKHPRALLAAFLLAISPWHIQYSRVTLEVSALLFFMLLGVFLFYRSLKKPGILSLSVIFLSVTPYIYSTAKFFTPVFVIFLFLNWRREIWNFPRKHIFIALLTGFVVSLPIYASIFFGKGAERAKYTSVFSDPTTASQVAYKRTYDANFRGDLEVGYSPKIIDKVFHNKIYFWWEKISGNLLEAFSFNFLFVEGDPNLRHSPERVGQFYRIESLTLIFGIVLFFSSKIAIETKALIIFWTLLGAVTASITREGGNHATRLILTLPPLVFLISYGIVETSKRLKELPKTLFLTGYFLLLSLSFVFYLHEFYVHYPWSSERWWNYGYKELIQQIKVYEPDYEKIIISTAEEPPMIFLAAYYPISPEDWQKGLEETSVNGLGGVSHLGKFYFGKYPDFEDISSLIDTKTLYAASATETKSNLLMDPEKAPDGIKILQVVRYQSGDPAFYLLTKDK